MKDMLLESPMVKTLLKYCKYLHHWFLWNFLKMSKNFNLKIFQIGTYISGSYEKKKQKKKPKNNVLKNLNL